MNDNCIGEETVTILLGISNTFEGCYT